MSDKEFDCDVVIVGAGLSGLACANLLYESGLHVALLEAQNRIGGRIHSLWQDGAKDKEYIADLGPTWVWPLYQPIVKQWLERLNVKTFRQFEEGDAVLDLNETSPPLRQPLPGQHGIVRIHGGPQSLIEALFGRLPPGCVITGQTVNSINAQAGSDSVMVSAVDKQGAAGRSLRARRVVIAVPLRGAVQMISCSPALDERLTNIMTQTPTWMAAQAKAVILYDKAFWREQGLSGRVASHVGPLAELHDHSMPGGEQAALFGFVGWPHERRRTSCDQLKKQIESQLIRCFGKQAANYSALHIEDWASNRAICSDLDLSAPPDHPIVAPDIVRAPHLGGRLYFAVSETATQSPGLIEGAFEAAQAAAAKVIAAHRSVG